MSNTETKNINSKKHSPIFPNINVSNMTKIIIETNSSNSNNSSKRKSKKHKKSEKKEKIIYNAFTNLTKTQEKSFQLNSSYDNINKISKNKYIKDINLQSKIKQIIINECKDDDLIKKKSSFLKLPDFSKNPKINNTPKSSHKGLINFGCVLSEIENDKNDNVSPLPSKRLNNNKGIIDRPKTTKSLRIEKNVDCGICSSKKKYFN